MDGLSRGAAFVLGLLAGLVMNLYLLAKRWGAPAPTAHQTLPSLGNVPFTTWIVSNLLIGVVVTALSKRLGSFAFAFGIALLSSGIFGLLFFKVTSM
ncbi:MAG TPA: hypothetical protein VJ843_05480 [Candidatus Saccharimonadales bacterium]|nr:hypothetical protein [Candidatus Saccharimonadales bacterium]